MLKIEYKILLSIIFCLSIFIFSTEFVFAEAICERDFSGGGAGEITINLKIAYFQTDLAGGDGEIPKPVMDASIESNWKGTTSACGVPVEVKVDSIIFSGTESGCKSAHSDLFCIKIEKDRRHTGGSWEGGMITSSFTIDPSYSVGPVTVSKSGWWNYSNESDYLHETGHLFGLAEEYSVSPRNSSGTVMGNTTGAVMQKHIDQIVKLNCFVDNFVCEDNLSPHYNTLDHCCDYQPESFIQYYVGWTAETCGYDAVLGNTCPANTCTRIGYGDTCDTTTCKCSGATCVGVNGDCLDPGTPPQTCVDMGKIVGTGSCSDATKICCKDPAPPPTLGGGGSGFGSGPSGCSGIGCLSCIKAGTCTICNLMDVAYEVAKFLLGIVGAITLLFVVYGSFIILLSAGIGERVDQGKRIIINSIIGMIITFSAYLMVTTAVWLATGQTQVFGSSLKCVPNTPPSSPTGRPAVAPPTTPTTPVSGGTPCADICTAMSTGPNPATHYPLPNCVDSGACPSVPEGAPSTSPSDCTAPQICCCTKNPL